MRRERQMAMDRLEQLARWRASAVARVANYRTSSRTPVKEVLLEELDFSLEQVQVVHDELRRMGEELADARREVEQLRGRQPLSAG